MKRVVDDLIDWGLGNVAKRPFNRGSRSRSVVVVVLERLGDALALGRASGFDAASPKKADDTDL